MTALSDTAELVKRLDEIARAMGSIGRGPEWQAARRLEALQAEVERLRQGLLIIRSECYDGDPVRKIAHDALDGAQVERLSTPSPVAEGGAK